MTNLSKAIQQREECIQDQKLLRAIKKCICPECLNHLYKECAGTKVCPIAQQVENRRQIRELLTGRIGYLKKHEVTDHGV
jgi:hypothetical protein